MRPGERSGAVLLEVILALVLFVAAAVILSSGLSSSLDALERLRLNTHAADMAVSVLSELQLGIKSSTQGGPQPLGVEGEGWTWELQAAPVQTQSEGTNAFEQVEVIIRHEDPAVVYRLTQVLPAALLAGKGQEQLPGVGSF